MKSHAQIAQLILRFSLGIGFLSAVFDRLGWLGAAGGKNIAWGNWQAFLQYVHVLLPWIADSLATFFGWLATLSEVSLAVMLILGYKTRLAAYGSSVLTLIFVICMSGTIGYKATFNYSVPAFSAGALLLSALPNYRWSLDRFLTKHYTSTYQ